MTKTDKLTDLKEKFLDYYARMPIKKYAAYSIGKDEDTTKKWENADSEFADKIRQAKANYLLNKGGKLKPEFIIPVLFREMTPRQEMTGKDGEPLQGLVIVKHGNESK